MRLLDRPVSLSSLFAFLALTVASGCGTPPDATAPEDDFTSPVRDRASIPAVPSSQSPSGSAPISPAAKTTDLYYSTAGSPADPAVVFIHGGPGANSKMFELTVQDRIAKLGYYVVAYDQRGSVRSPQGTSPDYSFARSTQDLDDLVGALNLKSPILLGHSFGGSIALHYLERFKGKAKGAVLVASPMSFPETYDTTLAQCGARYKMWGRSADAAKVAALRASMFPQGLTPPYAYSDANIASVIACQSSAKLYFPPLPTQGELSFALAHGHDRDVQAVNPAVGSGYQANDQVGYGDFTPMLQAHRNEVLGIYAPSWDVMFSRSQLGSIQASVRSYATVANAGHFLFLDQPEDFTATLGNALRQLK